MTTEQEPIAETPAEEVEGNEELRAALKRSQTALKEANQRTLSRDLTDIGLDANAGLGKAIAKEYDGDMTIEALATYARDEYGHDPGVAVEVPPEVASQERLDEAMQTSTSVLPVEPKTPGETQVEMINTNDPEATRQDAITSIQAKAQEFEDAFYQK